jgi:GNAT superfamily N-acetyltransferase
MNDVVIRECTHDDIGRVLELDMAWEAEDSTYGYIAESAEGLAARLGPYFLVAEVRGHIAGFAYGSAHTSEGMAVIPVGEKYFEVDAIYVTAGLRNGGIGGMLLDSLVEAARNNGIKRFSVYTATKDLESILRFYRRHAFKQWYVRMFR